MHLVDDRGQELDADYYGKPDGAHVALILKSRSGRNAPDPPRNGDYNPALGLLLARLGKLGAVLADALVDSDTPQTRGLTEADRRIISPPIRLALVPDVNALRLEMGRRQAEVGRPPGAPRGGASTKKIRLLVDVPGYHPADAARLAERLRAPIAEAPERVLVYSPVEHAEEAVQDAAGKAVRRGRGQGFRLDQEVKAAVEARAMSSAKEFYDREGWIVEDVHRNESYDLLCRQGSEVKHVEVKGTTEDGHEVILTRKEVEHARANTSTVLFIVSNINVEQVSNGTVTAKGGVRHIRDPWYIDDGTMTPLGFRYQVPAQRERDA